MSDEPSISNCDHAASDRARPVAKSRIAWILFVAVTLGSAAAAQDQPPPPPPETPSFSIPPAPPLGSPTSSATSEPEPASAAPETAATTSAPPADLCASLPAGPLKKIGDTTLEPITEVDDIGRSAGVVAECVKGYSDPPDLSLAVYQYDSVDGAQRVFTNAVSPILERRSAAYGDYGVEEWESGKAGASSRYFGVTFRRGCYQFQGSDRMVFGMTQIPDDWQPVSAATIALIRSTAAQVDAQLKNLPPCPDEAGPPQTIVRVRNPYTGGWVPWLLVPGLGLVLYGAARSRKKGAATDPGNQTDDESKEYELDIRTQDNRTSLDTDGEDVIWVYAQVRCNKPEVNTLEMTESITFAAEGENADWLSLGTPQMSRGFKAVPVRAWPPSADAELGIGETDVMVRAIIEGATVQGPARLDLDAYELDVF